MEQSGDIFSVKSVLHKLVPLGIIVLGSLFYYAGLFDAAFDLRSDQARRRRASKRPHDRGLCGWCIRTSARRAVLEPCAIPHIEQTKKHELSCSGGKHGRMILRFFFFYSNSDAASGQLLPDAWANLTNKWMLVCSNIQLSQGYYLQYGLARGTLKRPGALKLRGDY